jgi:hypothetical protein
MTIQQALKRAPKQENGRRYAIARGHQSDFHAEEQGDGTVSYTEARRHGRLIQERCRCGRGVCLAVPRRGSWLPYR